MRWCSTAFSTPSGWRRAFRARDDSELSVMAEFGVKSAKRALEHAGLEAADIDMVICAASHHQRPYPAIAIEIQDALGMQGAAFDMGLGCSSAAAGLHVAFNLVRTGAQKRVLVVTPEIITAHLNFRDRQTHFIFGDASTAMVVQAARTRARRCPAASRSSTRAAGRSSPTTSAPISASSSAPARTTPRSW